MADRFPLILNTSANQIQEIASGDSLDLTGTNIANAGIITAGNVTIGAATTDLIVNGDARVTGILTIGTSSLKLDGPNNLVNVGTALTLGHTQGLQFHTQNLHSAGFEVNQVNASGIITATGADINGDLDVDGHTNLDNVNVVGVVTVTGAVNASHSNFGVVTALGLVLSNTNATILFTDTNADPDYSLGADGGVLKIRDTTNNADRLVVNTDGHIDINGNLDCLAGLDVTGNATVSGNLSVGGVLTYEDVTNIDSVGIITAREGVFLPDLKQLKIGNTAAAPDLYLWHNSSTGNSNISNKTGDLFIQGNNGSGTVVNQIAVKSNAAVELNYQGNKKFETTNTGATLLGELNATGANFTDDGQSSPIVSVMTDDANPWGLQVGNSTYNSSTTFGTQVYVNNTGEGYQYHIGSGAYKDFHFYQHNQSQSRLMLKFEADDNSVELYGRGIKDLETTGTGVVVTGVCTATSFVGGGSGLTSLSGSVVASALSGQNISGLGNVGIDATLTARNGVFNDNGGASPTVSISTDDQAPWAIQIKNDSYWNNASNGWKCYQDNSGNFYQTVTGNGAFINHYLQTINGSTTNTAILIGTDRSVTLYYQNNPKLYTTSSGASITGNMTATGTVNGDSGLIGNSRFFGAGGNANSILIKSGTAGSVALTLQDSGGNHKLELYGTGSDQGFLTNAWGHWDLRKSIDGQLSLRVGGSNYDAIHQGNVSGNVGLQSIVKYTSVGSHTWTKPSGITRIRVYVTGGGGGGGSHNGDDANGGGGAGGTAIEIIDVTNISSVAVTVGGGGSGSSGNNNNGAGDGGASSFGSHCTGGGGYGPNDWGIGGDGGTASGGDLNLRGGDGGAGNIDGYSNSEAGGSGGSSYWGGGPSGGTNWQERGVSGPYGTGGAGTHASSNNSGSDGLSGIVVVEQYKS